MNVEYLRWLAIFGGAVVLGMHLAVYANADRLTFHPNAWRVFVGGNSVLTLYAMLSLIHEPDRATIIVVGLAMLMTIGGLIALDLAYRKKQQKEDAYVGRGRT